MGQTDRSVYPYEEGEAIVLGPQVFVTKDGTKLCWRSEWYAPITPGRVTTNNDELFTVRDAMRSLNRIVDELANGGLDQAVLMKGGKMVAIIKAVS